MTALVIILTLVLLAVILVQIGRLSEISARIRGEEQTENQMLLFLVGFLVFCVVSAWMYKDRMLGYGPHEAASAHGSSLDSLFNMTLFFTGIVFVLTHIALFWFSFKYREDKNRIAYFFAHSTKLEAVWTIAPTFVLIFLVVKGLMVWNDVMSDVGMDEDHIEIEATGYQFAWDIRYPGADGKLGTKNYKLIKPGVNPLGQDWSDPKNIDDFHPADIVLPVNKKVRVRITAKDVLHNFYLPHFRVKMDAVPGLPTHFVFTPIKTTEEYRQELKGYPEWEQDFDPEDPSAGKRWENFNYELACAELCGTGHWSMRRVVKIVSEEEYEECMGSIRNTEDDPFKGQLLDLEILNRNAELKSEFMSALDAEGTGSIIKLKNVFFETGSAVLKDNSKFELNSLAGLLKSNSNLKFELGGHTDSQGDDAMNMTLSEARAQSVLNFLANKGVSTSSLTSKGYGENNPADTNDTEEGRANNRRTELKLISK